jgi:hypothetical protein
MLTQGPLGIRRIYVRRVVELVVASACSGGHVREGSELQNAVRRYNGLRTFGSL